MTLSMTSDEQMSGCINACDDCHSICTETVNYCMGMGGAHVTQEHIKLLLDCAEISQASANFMLRGSAMHAEVCGVCAEACERCATSCEQFPGDEQMEACVRACRTCAESCREMTSAA